MDRQVAAWVRNYQAEQDKIEALRNIMTQMFWSVERAAALPAPALRAGTLAAELNRTEELYQEFAESIGLRPDGFARLVEKKMPNEFKLWMDLRVKIGKHRL